MEDVIKGDVTAQDGLGSAQVRAFISSTFTDTVHERNEILLKVRLGMCVEGGGVCAWKVCGGDGHDNTSTDTCTHAHTRTHSLFRTHSLTHSLTHSHAHAHQT